ncbi:MAG: MoaD/ThiS family protein [Euryarchaeota archaeon]|nr:MoaD/ThiS family protein [Euryarchaeota archaeon]MDE1837892.1 MoaD/ThiS family protein [Euryarchaeota archaeon]MDE1881304.1 MoaD/ThiS family protein [Euryarchaeota archaeon]MDE2046238.1 MoaD/ThiS family protein [Thermoplasmata archaeon]
MVSVCFASALRSVARGQAEVDLPGFEGDLRGLLQALSHQVGPALGERLLEQGRIRRFVNVYVDGLDVRFSGGLETPVPKGATVDFIPAVAGG